MRQLRDYQSKAIDLVWTAMANGRRRPMLMMATGAGKTKTAAEIISRALAKGRRVVFTVPAIELIDQTVQAFGREGIRNIGVIQAQHPLTDYSQPVQIASIQTLRRRKLPETDLVIVDEAHVMHKIVIQWMKENPRLPFIGLSATPWTRGLGKYYDDLVIAATTQDLIRSGYLSSFKVFAPSHPDLSGVRTVAGDYDEGQLADAMDKPKLTADVVSTWIKLGEDRPTLCFAVNRAHARSLARDFEKAGVPCAYIDGKTERGKWDDIRTSFERGEVKVVVNVGVLTTGIDWDVRCIILARPTKSEMLYVQIIGRGLRLAEGKGDCLILDHSDSTLQLGFVTDIHHERLDDGKERSSSAAKRQQKELPLPKECPSCSRLKPAGVYTCPSCGFTPTRIQDVETVQGELAQLGGKQRKATIEDKQHWYSMLIGHLRQAGKTEGRAYYLYKEKFGSFPPTNFSRNPRPPSAEVASFVKAQDIRFAKAKEKARKVEEAGYAS